ncbi:ATP-binding protein [Verminephrobacter eiseniae]|nr:ATP-binding protein [Verminephrobacter eiseniae]MCW5295032.1 ATP-binding protein [Verminephrobacter eiseniae]MCW8186075.1 ATP-binding protein [Verminephrobacter eiseniae]MCW8224919.1 ATP-binding protein [Verminephrobacter eiseniae]MCW8235969.1 ATP-binding protein [Verminephrobacter eiseniae]
MLESLRGLGYSTGAALADIIDNSISAGAKEIRIDFTWNGSASRITVLDDGRGMDDSELESAMRLGDKNPLDTRDTHDLGRFGMGLKTASFSQCRRLTVVSAKDGSTSCLRWDLDELAADPDGGWLLFEGPASGSQPFIAGLEGKKAGTLVLWEMMDRIVTTDYTSDNFHDLIDNVESHLAMAFHRILQEPRAKIKLLLNGRAVVPWDPFMTGHPAKWASPIAKRPTDYGTVSVQCHVLPHRDKLTSAEFEASAGPAGWTAQQGFHVYRNERLLVAGGWLGLGNSRAWNREESHRLARICLDIPNTADADWKIDIRKSTARPPISLRPWLTHLAEDTRERARHVFAYRGAPAPAQGNISIEQAWRVAHLKTGMRYRIEETHPSVAAVLAGAGALQPLIRSMLRVIEETVPVQRIWLDTAENKETPCTGFEGEPDAAIIEVASVLFDDLTERKQLSVEEARKTMLRAEPFQKYPALVAKLGSKK